MSNLNTQLISINVILFIACLLFTILEWILDIIGIQLFKFKYKMVGSVILWLLFVGLLIIEISTGGFINE